MGVEKYHCLSRKQVLIPCQREKAPYHGALLKGGKGKKICQGPTKAKDCAWLPWHPDKVPITMGMHFFCNNSNNNNNHKLKTHTTTFKAVCPHRGI